MARQDGRRARQRYNYRRLTREGREKWLNSSESEKVLIAKAGTKFRIYTRDVWIVGLWVGLGLRRRYSTDYLLTVTERC